MQEQAAALSEVVGTFKLDGAAMAAQLSRPPRPGQHLLTA